MSESGLPLPTPELDHGAVLRHQVLVDPTGRRRRRLAIAGRVATTALGLWLAVLILGGLGLQPLAGIPIVGDLGARGAAPPALPERVQAAAAKRATGVPAPPAARASLPSGPLPTGPLPTGRVPSRHAGTAPSPAKPRPQVQKAPATTPGPAAMAPGVGPTSSAPAPSRLPKSPTTTAPGQTRTPPGHTKTAPGPPTTTPGTTPRGNDNAPAAKAR